MLMFYILGTGFLFALLLYGYSGAIDKRGKGRSRSRKGELAHNMWAATSLDCDFEPTKHAFGPGRSVNPVITRR
ncbi:MAG: hypothetical protein KAQ65_11035 [Candidatus Thorarchaeota archaeon]|nr:hypothetical protein [Candidatus Thorarchaeota archaeon]